MKRISFVALIALTTAACLGTDFGDSLDGTWQLTSGEVAGEQIVLVPTHPMTMTFDGDQVNGTAACNGYGGEFERDGSSITLSNMAATEMACSPPETMTAESAFLSALPLVESLSIDGVLTLRGPGVELVFAGLEPVPDAELTSTLWVLDALVTDDSVSSAAPTRATLEFFSDGSVLGDSGCRGFSGRYVINGAEVVVTDLASDGHECEADLAGQDNHVISTLEGTFRVEVEGDRLTITSAGDQGLVYRSDG